MGNWSGALRAQPQCTVALVPLTLSVSVLSHRGLRRVAGPQPWVTLGGAPAPALLCWGGWGGEWCDVMCSKLAIRRNVCMMQVVSVILNTLFLLLLLTLYFTITVSII
jgi:hypothetical protein